MVCRLFLRVPILYFGFVAGAAGEGAAMEVAAVKAGVDTDLLVTSSLHSSIGCAARGEVAPLLSFPKKLLKLSCDPL